jgi:diadenosine tetraphosphatase ApaH/serine/threonine PP2A family protein phosphatase
MEHAIAIISDIHANFEALSAVIDDLETKRITNIICLGDIVGYASGVNSCARAIRGLGCPTVLGNHDHAACFSDIPEEFNDTAAAGAFYAAKKLAEDHKHWMHTLPRVIQDGGVTFTHASLSDNCGWPYIVAEKDAALHFAAQRSPVAFCGHTHRPMIWIQNSHNDTTGAIPSGNDAVRIPEAPKVLINVGSVGQPRDGDPRACYVIYSPQRNALEFRRVPYNFKATRRKIVRAKLPLFSAQRLALGR